MTDEETLRALGNVAMQARKNKGLTKKAAGLGIGLSESTMATLEHGTTVRVANVSTQIAVENFYGWRTGAIQDLWERRRELHPTDVTLDLMMGAKPEGLAKASELTDQELMAELNFRFLMRDRREH